MYSSSESAELWLRLLRRIVFVLRGVSIGIHRGRGFGGSGESLRNEGWRTLFTPEESRVSGLGKKTHTIPSNTLVEKVSQEALLRCCSSNFEGEKRREEQLPVPSYRQAW